MRLAVVLLFLSLAACAAPVTLHEGPVTPTAWPQAAEQCQAQPDLSWCVHARQ